MKAAACIVLVVSALVAVACGGDSNNPVGPKPTTLAGAWKATRAEFVNASNPSQRVEVVAQGATITLTLQADGTFTEQTIAPGEAVQTMTGSWSASSDVLTLKPSGVSFEIQFDMTMNGDTLTLNGGHVQFDVNNDNQDEEAILYMTMARQ